MIYTCDKCGVCRADQIIDTESSLAICPECGFSRPFKLASLFAVGGASGTGKTAICKALAGKMSNIVMLDGDIIWGENRYSTQNPSEFYEDALRIAMNIAQSGVNVAIFNAGFGVLDNLEGCNARRYFSKIHYLGLYCSEEELEKRLSARPNVQGEAGAGFINAMKGFNHFFRFYNNDKPAMEKIDTTGITIEESARQVAGWIQSKR